MLLTLAFFKIFRKYSEFYRKCPKSVDLFSHTSHNVYVFSQSRVCFYSSFLESFANVQSLHTVKFLSRAFSKVFKVSSQVPQACWRFFSSSFQLPEPSRVLSLKSFASVQGFLTNAFCSSSDVSFSRSVHRGFTLAL